MADDCLVLPSGCSATALVAGEPGAVLRVGWDLLERATVIGVGLAVMGESRVVKPALIASLAIEAVVLTKAALAAR